MSKTPSTNSLPDSILSSIPSAPPVQAPRLIMLTMRFPRTRHIGSHHLLSIARDIARDISAPMHLRGLEISAVFVLVSILGSVYRAVTHGIVTTTDTHATW